MNEDEKTCEQLSAYMDGELDADASQGIERAIQSDPKLAAELARLRATRELVRRLDRVEAPAGLADSVLQQAERRCLVASAPVRGRLPAPRWLRLPQRNTLTDTRGNDGFMAPHGSSARRSPCFPSEERRAVRRALGNLSQIATLLP